MAIGNFMSSGVALNSGNSTLEGNFLGTDATGLLDRGNAAEGVFVPSNGNHIGGPTAAQRNVIAANDGDGILVWVT